MHTPGATPIHKATIVPRGHALGMVTQVHGIRVQTWYGRYAQVGSDLLLKPDGQGPHTEALMLCHFAVHLACATQCMYQAINPDIPLYEMLYSDIVKCLHRYMLIYTLHTHTSQVGRDDEFSINRQQMFARIWVCMGGQMAEELIFGRDQVTSGATDDLRQVRFHYLITGLSGLIYVAFMFMWPLMM